MEATSNSTMCFDVYIKLTESEARALSALPRYGADAFLKVFYEKLGETILKPHEKGLRELFQTIPDKLNPHLSRIDKTRKVFQDENPNKS